MPRSNFISNIDVEEESSGGLYFRKRESGFENPSAELIFVRLVSSPRTSQLADFLFLFGKNVSVAHASAFRWCGSVEVGFFEKSVPSEP